MDGYDVVILGSGQAARPLALAFAAAGRRVAFVEREHLGGTCINTGCTPTKTMVASARVAYLARRAGDFGVRAHAVSVDMTRVRERTRRIVRQFVDSSRAALVAQPAIDLLLGAGRFVGPRQLEVRLNHGGVRQIAGEVIVIDTGARTQVPRLEGLEQVPWLDHAGMLELAVVPEHLLVLGGGYVGLEFAQMFRRFGSRVTIVQRAAQLLPREDADVGAAIGAVLATDGIEIWLSSQARRVANQGQAIALVCDTPGGERSLVGSHLLVATGRTPNTEALDLQAAGIEVDAGGHVKVDERLATSAPGVFAVGDVKGGPAFTHIAYDDHRILRTNLLEGGQATTRGRMVPYVVFTDPELARIGLSGADARREGRDIRVARIGMDQVARALEMDEARGFLEVVIDARSQQILGATILGVGAGELMAVIEVAMMGGLTAPALRDATFAHPTLAECLNTVMAAR
ncbi:mercuric reductase [Nannocystis bainbridge]|uniref:Mercuric reductase n=1 Tax=Nannocystis bainbridge TaxID=2995303 RepID=A0ABT5DVH0_9BACT|nr:mercuric reductase [Nannocystis bainbridge]MDC0716703.1 mercuric reductase [Nannocystis bainbridge]